MDACDDLVVCDFLMRIEDCVPPLVNAIGLSSVVMPTSMEVTVIAQDFIAAIVDDCSPENWVLHSFDSLIFTPTQKFNCESLVENGSNAFLLKMWSGDAGVDRDCNGSISWDERSLTRTNTIIVIDQNGSCEEIEPFGRITSENQVPIPGVDVYMVFNNGDTLIVVQTDDDGVYIDDFINPLLDVIAAPSKGGDDSLGVSTLDLIKIQKHLLGIESFDSPYKYIAADANNTESVSAADLLELRKLILRINHKHPNNESWRFVPESFAFNNPSAPWPFDESIEITDSSNNNFIAVKIGDLNGTVTGAQFNEGDVSHQFRAGYEPLVFNVINQKVNKGDIIKIDVTSENFQEIIGFQYTMHLTDLELIDIYPGKLNITSDQYARHGDALTMSWFDLDVVSTDNSDILYSLLVRARSSSELHDLININSSLTRAESYAQGNKEESASSVQLRFINITTPGHIGNSPFEQSVDKSFGNSDYSTYEAQLKWHGQSTGIDLKNNTSLTLYQNEPNPFTSETNIPFNITKSGKVSLWIFSTLGREVYFSSRDFPAGRNAFRVNFSDISASGVLYYRVEKDGVVESRKMVSLR
jgi:hypothetical protein